MSVGESITTSSEPIVPPHPVDVALTCSDVQAKLKCQISVHLNRSCSWLPLKARQEQTEDIFQNVCLQAMKSRDKYDPFRTVGGWLYGITINVIREYIRREHRVPSVLGETTEFIESSYSHHNDEVEDMFKKLFHLNSDERQIIECAYLEELSHREIANRLSITEGNSRIRLQRAMGKLRRLMTDSRDVEGSR